MVSVRWPLSRLSSLVRCHWCDFVVISLLTLGLYSRGIWNLVVKRLNVAPLVSNRLMWNYIPTNIYLKNNVKKQITDYNWTISAFHLLCIAINWFTWVLFCILLWMQPRWWSSIQAIPNRVSHKRCAGIGLETRLRWQHYADIVPLWTST